MDVRSTISRGSDIEVRFGCLLCRHSMLWRPAVSVAGSASRSQRDGTYAARLLPLSGIAILLAHDIAWFILVLALTWPYPILPSIAACGMALAVGHHAAVNPPLEQRRWRFAQGRVAPTGVLQILALVSAGVAVHQFGWPILPLFIAIYDNARYAAGNSTPM